MNNKVWHGCYCSDCMKRYKEDDRIEQMVARVNLLLKMEDPLYRQFEQIGCSYDHIPKD